MHLTTDIIAFHGPFVKMETSTDFVRFYLHFQCDWVTRSSHPSITDHYSEHHAGVAPRLWGGGPFSEQASMRERFLIKLGFDSWPMIFRTPLWSSVLATRLQHIAKAMNIDMSLNNQTEFNNVVSFWIFSNVQSCLSINNNARYLISYISFVLVVWNKVIFRLFFQISAKWSFYNILKSILIPLFCFLIFTVADHA